MAVYKTMISPASEPSQMATLCHGPAVSRVKAKVKRLQMWEKRRVLQPSKKSSLVVFHKSVNRSPLLYNSLKLNIPNRVSLHPAPKSCNWQWKGRSSQSFQEMKFRFWWHLLPPKWPRSTPKSFSHPLPHRFKTRSQDMNHLMLKILVSSSSKSLVKEIR